MTHEERELDRVLAYLAGINSGLSQIRPLRTMRELFDTTTALLTSQPSVHSAAVYFEDAVSGAWSIRSAAGADDWPAQCPYASSGTSSARVLPSPIVGSSFVEVCPIHIDAQQRGTLLVARTTEPSAVIVEVDAALANTLGGLIDAVSEREQLFGALNHAPALIGIHRGDEHRLTFKNALYDARVNTPVGQTLWETNPGNEGVAALQQVMDSVVKTGEPFIGTAVSYDVSEMPGFPDQDKAYFDYVIEPMVDSASDNVSGVFTHGIDVTERIEALQKLEAANQRLEVLVSDVDAIVWEASVASFQFTFVSDAAEEMTGYPPAQWLTQDFWPSLIHPGDRKEALAYCSEHLHIDDDFDFEYRIVTADGRVLWVHDLVHVARDAEGNAVDLRGLIIDISARKHAEEENRRIQEQLLQVQKLESLGVLAGGIAHDFNNLLTAILGNASLVQLTMPPSDPSRQRVDAMVTAAKRAADLTQELLAYSGKGAFQIKPLDLSKHLSEGAHLLETTLPKKVQLQLDVAEDLPLVEADAAQMQQVFMNLVLNGAEAIGAERGTVVLTTSVLNVDERDPRDLLEELSPGRYVCAQVHDTGCGIDVDTQKRIFEPFYSTKAQGRGLGLAAVMGIVRGHGGAIRIYSTPGEGTTFKVYLPASTATRAPDTAEEMPAVVGGTVLIIDDEEDVRIAANHMLGHLGFDTLEACDGIEGLTMFKARHQELTAVLLDMTMPEMGGEEVFREIRRMGSDVPVILSSGYNESQATRRFSGKGLAGFLQKPYTIHQLAVALSVKQT